jgi:hypothetical protein
MSVTGRDDREAKPTRMTDAVEKSRRLLDYDGVLTLLD